MSKFKSLKVGEVLSETQYYKVEKVQGNRAQLINSNGDSIVLNDGYIDNLLSSASQFEEIKKVTRTELAEKFIANARVAMTVMFHKKVDPKQVTANVAGIYSQLSMGLTEAAFQKKVKAVLDLKGEERVMVGRHYGDVDVNGRVSFVDMNVSVGNPNRLVDPRTIDYLIVGGVKYELK
jgi:hypothetical protein